MNWNIKRSFLSLPTDISASSMTGIKVVPNLVASEKSGTKVVSVVEKNGAKNEWPLHDRHGRSLGLGSLKVHII